MKPMEATSLGNKIITNERLFVYSVYTNYRLPVILGKDCFSMGKCTRTVWESTARAHIREQGIRFICLNLFSHTADSNVAALWYVISLPWNSKLSLLKPDCLLLHVILKSRTIIKRDIWDVLLMPGLTANHNFFSFLWKKNGVEDNDNGGHLYSVTWDLRLELGAWIYSYSELLQMCNFCTSWLKFIINEKVGNQRKWEACSRT